MHFWHLSNRLVCGSLFSCCEWLSKWKYVIQNIHTLLARLAAISRMLWGQLDAIFTFLTPTEVQALYQTKAARFVCLCGYLWPPCVADVDSLFFLNGFWATICKMVRPMLLDRCLSVCPVCNVGVLWPNGWTDPGESWHAGRPWPWSHCVRWGPMSPTPQGHSPPDFQPISVVAKWLYGSRCHLVGR